MDSLNRFCFALGLLALVTGIGLMYSSRQLVLENRQLNEKVKTLNLQRLHPAFTPKYADKALIMMAPPGVALPNHNAEWIKRHNQFKRMPNAVDD